MGTYRNEWNCCGSATETEAWEPEHCPFCTDDAAPFRKDAERYRWLRDLLAVEDVARLVDEHAQWSWCETDPAESAKTDAAVDKAMSARRAVGAA